MNSQLVPITIQIEYECALLAMQIADRQRELTRLQRELSPLETAFGLFERKVANQSSSLTAERNRLRRRCLEIERYTERIHARLLADPDRHLSMVFSPEELRAIADLFGIYVDRDVIGDEPIGTASGAWEWAEQRAPVMHPRQLPAAEYDELRATYRQLAKIWHPDLALNDEDASYRQEMMLRINHAWQERDLSALRRIQRGHSLDNGVDRYRQRQLERLQRELAQVIQRCAQTQARLNALRRSKTRALWYDAALANVAITRHVRKLEAEIEQLQQRETTAVEEFRLAFGHYASLI
ncbi:MAG: J domain-containing protein [Thermomicrobiales bacterium]|nr:J domain-containing protein [Thermomicrobiales bacterium]